MNSHKNLHAEEGGSKFSKYQGSRKYSHKESASELTEEIGVDQIARLENIVYSKVIPILQTDLDIESRRPEKAKKGYRDRGTNNEGLLLLERLNRQRDSVDMDGYMEVLEKFIRRVMDKEETLMNRLTVIQEKLEV